MRATWAGEEPAVFQRLIQLEEEVAHLRADNARLAQAVEGVPALGDEFLGPAKTERSSTRQSPVGLVRQFRAARSGHSPRQLDLHMQSLRSRSASRSRSPSQQRRKSPRASSRSAWRSHWGTGLLDAERTWPTYNLDFRRQDKRPQPRDRSPFSPSSPSSRFTFTGRPLSPSMHRFGSREVVAMLRRALLNAATRGDAAEVQGILRKASEDGLVELLDARDQCGRTPLHCAARHGHAQVCHMLLRLRADIHAAEGAGGTALTLACLYGQFAAVRCLLQHGARPEQVDQGGRTAFHCACCGSPEVVYDLLRISRGFAFLEDARGRNPLFYAMGNNDEEAKLEVVKLLLEAKSSASQADVFGRPALFYATQSGDVKVLALLVLAVNNDPAFHLQAFQTLKALGASGPTEDPRARAKPTSPVPKDPFPSLHSPKLSKLSNPNALTSPADPSQPGPEPSEASSIPQLLAGLLAGTDQDRETAAAALEQKSADHDSQVAIVQKGGIQPLIELLAGSVKARESAVQALRNLASNEENQEPMAREGAVPPLVEMLKSGIGKPGKLVAHAAEALERMARNENARVAVVENGAVEVLVQLLKEGSAHEQECAVQALRNLALNGQRVTIGKDGSRKLLGVSDPNVGHKRRVLEAGAVEPLIQLLQTGSAEAQAAAAGTVANLSLGAERAGTGIVGAAILPLVRLLKSGNVELQLPAARALANLALYDKLPTAIAEAGAIPLLLELLKNGNGELQIRGAGALAMLARDANLAATITKAGAIPLLAGLLKSRDVELQMPIGALANLARHGNLRSIIADAGAIPLLVELLKTGNVERQMLAVGALVNLAPKVGGTIAEAGAIPHIVELLRSGNVELQKEAAKLVVNLSLNDSNLRAEIVKAEAIQPLAELLKSGCTSAQEKAAKALEQLAFGNEDYQVAIAAAGTITPLVHLFLGAEEAASRAASGALQVLANNSANAEEIKKVAALRAASLEKSEEVQDALEELKFICGDFSSGDLEDESSKEPEVPAGDSQAAPIALKDGTGSRLAMFSARFNAKNKETETKMRQVHKVLRDHKYDVLMVDAGLGDDFGKATRKFLNRLRRENGIMLCVCSEDYAEVTASKFSSYEELRYANSKGLDLLPLQVADTFPPEPPSGPEHMFDKDGEGESLTQFAFNEGVRRLDCRTLEVQEIAQQIAERLHPLPPEVEP